MENSSDFFHFKAFSLRNISSAMKVNTDGVLLGAWMAINPDDRRLLDIGSGTGVISLIAAQRRANYDDDFSIEGVDIDDGSYQESLLNYSTSPWKKNLSAFLSSIQAHSLDRESYFDHIFTNPPYFENALKSPLQRKNKARHSNILPYRELINSVKTMLKKEGIFSVILPSDNSELFVRYATEAGLYLNRLTSVYYKKTNTAKRELMEFSYIKTPLDQGCLIIQNNNSYTDEYKKLMSPYYINF